MKYQTPNNRINSDWQFRYAPLPAGYAERWVVGDVCLSRRKNDGRHTVVPLHASIQEHCRRIGFDNLAPIIWHKIANAAYGVGGQPSAALPVGRNPDGRQIRRPLPFVGDALYFL